MSRTEDYKRHSGAYYGRESMDRARSGSNKQASLRRKNVDTDAHHIVDRSKSAISVESRGANRQQDFSLHNQACEEGGIDLR